MLKRAIACLAVIGSLSIIVRAQSPVQYFYDDLGRLIGVIDQNGNGATYTYDAVGNLLSITRSTAGTVSIIALSPDNAAVGATITIEGTGFSATASQDAVTFNGTAATITSATANQLVVVVPPGATSGTIGVTSPSGSATSAAAFTVVTGTLAPTITSFTPNAGVAGTSVTITGTNFDTVLSNDRTRFNAAYADLSSATTTTISAPVPSNMGSGHITVATPMGSATSTDDFIIPPPPFTVSDVYVSGRIPFTTPTTVTINTANTIGLMLFDPTPGHRVSLQGTNGVSGKVFGCDIYVAILRPDTTQTGLPTCMESSGFLDATPVSMNGTYTILVDPAATVTGGVTLTLYDIASDVTGTIVAGGSAVTVTTTIPGQNAELTFAGTAGQRVSLRGTNGMSGQIIGCDVNVSILNPDRSTLAPPTCMESSGYIDVTTLPTTGTYTIDVDPASFATGSLTLTLYNVPPDITGNISPGGSPVTVTTTAPGQNAALTFAGTAGERVSLQGTNGMSGQILGCDVNVSILNPDGSTLASPTCMESSGFIDVTTLPTTGTYTIDEDPVSFADGSLTLTLYNVPADASGAVTIGGSAFTLTTTTPGQNGAVTFAGTSGQQVTVHLTGNTMSTILQQVTVKLLDPSGTLVTSTTSFAGSFNLTSQTLSTTGTYTIVIDPAGANVGSITINVTNP